MSGEPKTSKPAGPRPPGGEGPARDRADEEVVAAEAEAEAEAEVDEETEPEEAEPEEEPEPEDPVERKLKQLQAELEAESAQAKRAIEEARAGVRPAANKKKAAAKPGAGDPKAAKAAKAGEGGESPEKKGLRARAEKEAATALTEVVTDTIQGKGLGNAAVDVAKRRWLPSLPTREEARNLALGAGGVAVAGYLAWGILGPIFAFAWMLTKIGLLGGGIYGGWWVYSRLPSGKPEPESAKGDAEADADEDAEPETKPTAKSKPVARKPRPEPDQE